MSGAFNQAADAVAAALAAEVATVRNWERYSGQGFDQMRELVRAKGTSAFVRAVGAEAAGGEEVPGADCAELAVQIAVAAPSHKPDSALDSAWETLWECYEALRGTKGGCAWLLEDLRFVSATLEEQSADCAVVSLTMAAHADLADLDESVVNPDTELPTLAKSPPADADRLTLWDSAASWARKYVAWSVVKSTLKTYFDAVYAGLAHASRHGSAGADALTPEAIGADAAGTAAGVRTVALTPAELTPSVSSPFAVDYATDRQVQDLGTVSTALTLTKGTGWPASGSMAYVLLKMVISGTPTITWTVVGQWTSDAPAAAGTYYVHLRQICGVIVASAEAVQ
jgi:hypothetical protein